MNRQRRLLLVHAHPDDETIATGGTITYYVAAGVGVTVVTCTLGEQGEIIPPELAELEAARADQLGGYRIGELRAACRVLGVTDHRFLGAVGRWRDSGMAGAAGNEHPRAFVHGDRHEQAAQLTAILDDVRPSVVVTYDANGGYGHPDHIRAHDITMAAAVGHPAVARVFHVVSPRSAIDAGVAGLAQLASLPYRLPEPGELPGVDDSVVDTRIELGPAVETRLRALRAHSTQVTVWRGGERAVCFALSNGIAQPVLDAEYFALAYGDRVGAERDLFGGLVS